MPRMMRGGPGRGMGGPMMRGPLLGMLLGMFLRGGMRGGMMRGGGMHGGMMMRGPLRMLMFLPVMCLVLVVLAIFSGGALQIAAIAILVLLLVGGGVVFGLMARQIQSMMDAGQMQFGQIFDQQPDGDTGDYYDGKPKRDEKPKRDGESASDGELY
ncbi:MAG: hypothetical protein GYB65_08905 [Chloroflexi bacterium]|nr:hypothetical protein [Chloroflexota bacterium]